jgi:hypothetical protein
LHFAAHQHKNLYLNSKTRSLNGVKSTPAVLKNVDANVWGSCRRMSTPFISAGISIKKGNIHSPALMSLNISSPQLRDFGWLMNVFQLWTLWSLLTFCASLNSAQGGGAVLSFSILFAPSVVAGTAAGRVPRIAPKVLLKVIPAPTPA